MINDKLKFGSHVKYYGRYVHDGRGRRVLRVTWYKRHEMDCQNIVDVEVAERLGFLQ